MKTWFWIGIMGLLLGMSSCGSVETTDDGFAVIPRDEMAGIIYDMNLVEAAYRGRMHNDTLAEEQMLARMTIALEKRSVTREQFLSNYEYYLDDPEEMAGIYNDALAKLSTHLSEVEELEK